MQCLLVPTPQVWFEAALGRLDILLLDHAACEKKAASSALALLFSYPEDSAACQIMARLAREELRHFEQVEKLRAKLAVPFQRLPPGRYARELGRILAPLEPARRMEQYLLAALIEARSHERFIGLVEILPAEIASLYAQLAVAEARHRTVYMDLARRVAAEQPQLVLEKSLARLAELEAVLVTQPDPQFRFHSGPPESP